MKKPFVSLPIAATALLLSVLAGCLSSQSPAAPEPGQEAQVQEAQRGPAHAPLANFHRALASLQAGRIERLNVVQIGDSHTAGDHFSGRLREMLQARFGNGGRGMLPPGSPFPYWRPQQVQVRQQGSWEVISSNRTDYQQIPYGLSGFDLRSKGNGGSLTLRAEGAFDSVDVSFFRQPGGGKIDLTANGRYLGEVDTRGPAWQLDHRTVNAPGSTDLELRTRGTVDLADWGVYRRERGVVLTSHGFSGAQISIMDRWDEGNLTTQLRTLAPALVILAFGTNEGFDSVSSVENYGSVFDSRIARLRQALPNASIVIVGPPDANRLPDYCNIRGPARERTACRPLNSQEAANYSSMLARRDPSLCRWHTPAAIEVVRQAQKQVAQRHGVLFWDWAAVQGGACGGHRWTSQELMRADHVHMYESGYGLSAEKLFDELMRGYRGR
jgi:lysophospholipase L1-like esterase